MKFHDTRTSGWRRLRMARNEIDVLRQEAEKASDRALAAGARAQSEWWSGRADGLRAADTLLLSLLQEARRKP